MRSWRGMVRLLAGSIALGLLVGPLQAWQTDPLSGGGGEVRVAASKNYDEARDRARIAWERMQEQDLKPEAEKELRAEALQNFRFALAHVPVGTKVEELNTIRYCLAYLYWVTEKYYEAAVMGEFLARCYTDRPEAQQGAKIALAAYAKLLGEATSSDDRTFEDKRMQGIARFIAEHWPNSDAANDAWRMLIRAAVTNRDLDKTVEYLGHVAVDSPQRGDMELMTGQALWAAYLDAARLPEAKRPAKAEMAKMFSQAQAMLEDGVRRLRKPVDAGGEVSYTLASGVLSLAQICLDAGQAEAAIVWLDDPKIGPHTLTQANHTVTNLGNFRVETLKAALRAYVAAQQLEKVQQTISALEKASDGANLTRIYLSLGRQLEESLKRARAEGDSTEAAKVARGFASFLTSLSARPLKETNFNTLSWVAQMFMSLGASLDPGNGKPPAQAADYYQKAAQTYRAILEASRADEHYAPQPSAIYGIEIRLARCLRRLGKHGEALDALVEVLKVQNNIIEAQREAAYSYQAWGEEDPDYYLLAIRGGHKVERKDGSVAYLIWGWGGIARKVQSSESYQNLFQEARYNLAICRFQYAISKSGQQRTDLLKQAIMDIMVVYKLYPEMGGKQRYDQYDALLKKIQNLLGSEENGLKAFDAKSSAIAPRPMVAELGSL